MYRKSRRDLRGEGSLNTFLRVKQSRQKRLWLRSKIPLALKTKLSLNKLLSFHPRAHVHAHRDFATGKKITLYDRGSQTSVNADVYANSSLRNTTACVTENYNEDEDKCGNIFINIIWTKV